MTEQISQPDLYFTASQIGRLQELLAAARRAVESGETFPDEARAELHGLIAAELAGSARRVVTQPS